MNPSMFPFEFIRNHLHEVDRKLNKYKVLFIDDEILNLKYFKKLVTAAGVLCTSDSDEALKLIKKHKRKLALVLADQHMPGLQGHEILKFAAEKCPDAVRMIVTGNLSRGGNWEKRAELQKEIDAFAMDIIEKPWSGYTMDKIVKTAVRYYLYRKYYTKTPYNIRDYYASIVWEYQRMGNPPLALDLLQKAENRTIGVMDLIPDRLVYWKGDGFNTIAKN